MRFERDVKIHTLQGIRDDCPQANNKRMEVLKWCQKKGEATTQQLGELPRLTLEQEEKEDPTLTIRGIGRPLRGNQELEMPTSELKKIGRLFEDLWRVIHPTLEMGKS